MTRMHTVSSLAAATAAAVAMVVGAGGAVAEPPARDAACPSSLRSVPGGTRDEGTRGFDDGVVGPDQAYRPGQMLLRLDKGSTAAEFACVLRELGAVKLAGGRGSAGFAGMSDLMLVQLPPARSVLSTGRLLLAPRYRDLMDAAQPNWITRDAEAPCPPNPLPEGTTAPFPNDTYFPYQWGLGPGTEAAQTEQVIAAGDAADADTPCNSVVKWPGKVEDGKTLKVGDAVYTMRLPQAWPLTKRWYWFNRAVKIGIVDNSLVRHPDLEGSVEPNGSRVITAAQIVKQRLRVLASQGEFTIATGGGDISCPIPHNATAADIKFAVERRLAVMCDVPASASGTVSIRMLEVTGNRGSIDLSIGNSTLTIAGEDLANRNAANVQAVISGDAALKPRLDSGDLLMRPLANSTRCSPFQTCSRWILARKSPPAGERVDTDARRLLSDYGFGTMRGDVSIETPRFRVKAETEPGTFSAEDDGDMLDAERWTFAPAGAAKVESVTGRGYEAQTPSAPASGTWPGQVEEKPLADHGQKIAGMIGAQANNRRGIAGALGPYIRPRIMMAITSLDTAAALVAIKYLAGYKRVPVVNYSRGGTPRLDDMTDPVERSKYAQAVTNLQEEDPRPKDLTQQQMARYPGTLFVVAAGNMGSSLRDLSPRASQEADYGPCAPKGMGITDPPGRSKNARQGQDKGGALSMLRMPDGTFDRGNILCVASMAPPRQETAGRYGALRETHLSEFSSWGAGIVDVAAPGEAVIGTARDNGYASGNGTSFAAPLVTGVAGLIFALHPSLDPSLVKCAILSSATTAPLSTRAWTSNTRPFRGYPLPPGSRWAEEQVLTVPGMVVATEALSAAAHLKNRTSGIRAGKRVDRGQGPTCVQERDQLDNGTEVWVDTTTKPVPPRPQPNPPNPPNPPAGP